MPSENEDSAIYWANLRWPEIQQLMDERPLVLWAFGAIEQHGVHLPLNTDVLPIAEMARRASSRTGVALLPTLEIGDSLVHGTSFPGTLSLRPETLMRIVQDVAPWLVNAGVKKLLILNGNGGNVAPLMAAARNIQHDTALLVKVMAWVDQPDIARDVLQDVPLAPEYTHGGVAETSLMLRLSPVNVIMSQAPDEADQAVAFDLGVDQVSVTGTVGRDSSKATALFGEHLIQRATDAIVSQVQRMLNEEPPYPRESPSARLRRYRNSIIGDD